ncbi:MAG: 23S rRNA (guanosine(2251)-2'-O)-methyltransferase RlmB [Chitinophagales bacterium]
MQPEKPQVIYGRKPILDALLAGQRFEKLLMQKGAEGEELQRIKSAAAQQQLSVQFVPKEKLDYITRPHSRGKEVNHQGVFGLVALIDYCSVDDLLNLAQSKGEDLLLVALDGVTDVRNFGAIARSAECLGAHGMLLAEDFSAPVNAEALKASAGALTRLAVCREKSLSSSIKYLKANGIQIVAADMHGSVAAEQYEWKQPVVIVMGAEGSGVSPTIRKWCDAAVHIPMKGTTESLNVGVSAAIILYEALRQRSK